jgi:YD repeat-containing protein
MQAAMLLTIRDPLGVKTQFAYEANSAYFYPVIGGVRVHSITTTDSVTGIQNFRRFVYQGGVLFKVPNYLLNIQNEFFVLPNALTTTPGYEGYNYSGLNDIYALLKTSQSFVPLQDAQGNHIGYGNVTEIFGNNGQGGSNVYTYQMNLGVQGDSRLSLYNYASVQDVQTVFNGAQDMLIGDSSFNNILPQNLVYYNGYIASLLYPLAPDQIDVTRGKLSNVFTYDSAGNLIKSVYNTYNLNYHEYNWMRGLKVYQIPLNLNPSNANNNVWGGTPSNLNALTFYKLHTGISHLVSSTESDYKDGKVMVTIHNYGYEDTLHTLQTSDTSVTSQGDSIIKKTYYSFDYANSATSDGVFGKMKSRNMLLPVSTRIWKNNQLLSGTVTQYQDFSSSGSDSFINPAKIYAFQTSVPMTPTQAGENIKFSSQFTSLLPNSSFIEKADFTISGTSGRIIQQKLVYDKDQALIWDNVYALPLAQIDNAYFTDVAYNSFESAETGNWTFTSTSVVTDTSAPTGTHAYTLTSSYPISKSSLNSSQTYVVSYWLKSGASASVSGGTQSGAITGRTVDNWTYHEVKVTGTTSISITGSGNVDEVRLYPSTAQMTSYTYDAMLRLITECSANSTISHYDYDALNRVIDIRDQYGNVVKAFQYNYGRQSRVSQ